MTVASDGRNQIILRRSRYYRVAFSFTCEFQVTKYESLWQAKDRGNSVLER